MKKKGAADNPDTKTKRGCKLYLFCLTLQTGQNVRVVGKGTQKLLCPLIHPVFEQLHHPQHDGVAQSRIFLKQVPQNTSG